ncbi:MAG: hypothetical protein OEX77_02815, partial [Candidatus Bathyarchaeota archaeon]|nr:hypothetical protein [Candidatus Bathyarchaeota archaeon]
MFEHTSKCEVNLTGMSTSEKEELIKEIRWKLKEQILAVKLSRFLLETETLRESERGKTCFFTEMTSKRSDETDPVQNDIVMLKE